jgi:hypothetical protein
VITYNLVISTDGIFATLIILYFSAALAAQRTSSVAAWVAAGIIVAIAIFVRPAGYFLLGGLVVLVLLAQRRRLTCIKIAGASFVAVFISMTILTNSLSSSQVSRSILGLALLPHVIHLLNADEQTVVDSDVVETVTRVSAPYKDAMNKALANSWTEAYELETKNFNPITQKINDALRVFFIERSKIKGEVPQDIMVVKEILDVYPRLAYRIVLNDPLGYLEIVAVNLKAAYQKNSLIMSPGYGNLEGASLRWWYEQTRANAVTGVRHLGLEIPEETANERLELLQTVGSRYLDLLHRLGTLLPKLAVLSAFYLIASVLIARPPAISALLGIYAIVLHFGATLLVCLTTVSIPRYSVPIDVLLLLALGFAMNLLYVDAKRAMSGVSITIN